MDLGRWKGMTNEEAIKTLEANYPDACFEQLREAVDAAIEALKAQDADSDTISRKAAIDAILAVTGNSSVRELYEHVQEHGLSDMWSGGVNAAIDIIIAVPSAQPEPEWNNHTVACLLAELFGDACACNYNGIDEWLPEKCEVIDACPNPVGVACWEQFLKHRAERIQP